MDIYLHWKTNQQDFLPLFEIEIVQEEGCFAKARLVIEALAKLPNPGTEATLQGEDSKVFFRGMLESGPLKVEGSFAEIELIAKPHDFLKQSEEVQKKSRVHPFWDALYIRPDKLAGFEERQDIKMSSLYCDRITGEVFESSWFEGKQFFNLRGDFFEDSLQLRKIGRPLKSCTVRVHAQWVQTEWGVANLSSAVRRAFPYYKVNTYTKEALQDKWPETGKRLGRSGVWILKSELKPVYPPPSLYPKYSSQLPLEDNRGVTKPFRMRRHWFKPTLWVGWKVKQKRKETLIVTLTQESGEEEGKQLEFRLQNINPDPNVYPWQPEVMYKIGDKICYKSGIYRCVKAHTSSMIFEESNWTLKKTFHTPLGDQARASFFLTDRGYLASEHAMERARVELAKSNRNLEVSFEGTWAKLKDITTDSSVLITDPRLPGGEIKGKVVKYSLTAKGDTGECVCRITLLCRTIKDSVKKLESKSSPDYVIDNYCDKTYQIHDSQLKETPTGLQYFRYDDKTPPQGQGGPLIRGIELINGPVEQEAEIRTHKTPSALTKAMKHKPTRLRLYFKDLRTRDCMEHVIPLTIKQ